jgi:hypothetical protein
MRKNGSGAKNLALSKNRCKPSQLGKLINLITWKMAHKDKNYSIKLRKYFFCTTTKRFGLPLWNLDVATSCQKRNDNIL